MNFYPSKKKKKEGWQELYHKQVAHFSRSLLEHLIESIFKFCTTLDQMVVRHQSLQFYEERLLIIRFALSLHPLLLIIRCMQVYQIIRFVLSLHPLLFYVFCFLPVFLQTFLNLYGIINVYIFGFTTFRSEQVVIFSSYCSFTFASLLL